MRVPVHALGVLILVCCVLISGCTSNPISRSGSTGNQAEVTASQAPRQDLQTTAPVLQNTPAATCRAGMTNCNGFCRDLNADIGNCGTCGIACPATQKCLDGQCVCRDEGYSACADRVCRNLNSDMKNCGACGIICPAGQICSSGQCTISCTGGKSNCGGTCVDLTTDLKNCGACKIACPDGQTCNNGQCGVKCINNLVYCNGQCRDFSADTANCGACGIVCPSGSSCRSGICITVTTAAPQPSWAGHWITQTSGPSEMDLNQDPNLYVTGTYSGGRGRILGTTSGNPPVLRGTWSWDNGAPAPFVFSMSADGLSFTGTYQYSGQTQNNPWTGHR